MVVWSRGFHFRRFRRKALAAEKARFEEERKRYEAALAEERKQLAAATVSARCSPRCLLCAGLPLQSRFAAIWLVLFCRGLMAPR